MKASARLDMPTAALARQLWTAEQVADLMARRDFRLLKLLSKDRRAESTAQRLGVFKAPMEWLQPFHAGGRPVQEKQRDGNREQREPSARKQRSATRLTAHRLLVQKALAFATKSAFNAWKTNWQCSNPPAAPALTSPGKRRTRSAERPAASASPKKREKRETLREPRSPRLAARSAATTPVSAHTRETCSLEGSGAWSAEEDAKLRRAVAAEYTFDQALPWKKVAAACGGSRSAKQCKRRHSVLSAQPASMASPD